ncbi:MAG: hypothetical protein LIO79_10395 [Rikenellaceae bacterium]|nr:hypothetical protein [Rikenellaceae bacterium]
MLKAGNYYTLKISRTTANGQYLIDEEGEEVLLPNRYVDEEKEEGDMMDVFVYKDSEDRIVATTEKPYAVAGEAAYLEVVDKTINGVFLDWGLAKDLFLPARNMPYRMDVGEKYVVFIYTDNVNGRVVASARISSFLSNSEITTEPGQQVEFLVAQKNDLGFRVIINNKHWGMLYHNQIFTKVSIGDKLTGYVRRITEDNRIDVSLQLQGYKEVKRSVDALMELVENNGGELPVADNSSPEEIHEITGMSKKVFKRTAGMLMKAGKITMEENRIIKK